MPDTNENAVTSDPVINVDQFVRSGGKIFHRREGNRIVTVAYVNDGEVIRYGATVHRRAYPSDVWVRKMHNQTALKRLKTAPVSIQNQEFDHVSNREQYIREAMFTSGCGGN